VAIEDQDKAHIRGARRGLASGDLAAAWHHCQSLLQSNPRSGPGLDVASRVALAMGQRRIALDLAQRAVEAAPDRFLYKAQLASALLAQKQNTEAIALIEALEVSKRSDPLEHDAIGNLLSQIGEQARAIECFRAATDLDSANDHHWLNLALCLQATGDMNAAEEAFDRCIALNPSNGEAWLHRSRLRSQSPENNHVPALQAALEDVGDAWRTGMTLHYALAKELEDLGDYDASFRHLKLGCDTRRKHMNHDPAADLKAMQLVREHFGRDYMSGHVVGYDSDEPIFIVGLPRTGTTLVERILSSHDDVYAAGELNNFAEVLTALVAPSKPRDRFEFIQKAGEVDSADLGAGYVTSTRPATEKCPRFIDKLPLNFLYCGLIKRALPNARIIHLTRHPMDTCYAIYKTLFKQAYPFSYDLAELGDYYLAYRELMHHWHTLMPGAILDLSYEQLVEDPEAQSRRLLSFCALEWQDQCLNFHRNRAPSMTASLAQVRKPIYSSSVGMWENYREQLAPLAARLEAAGIKL
jgi:tetratricopeptide (TPR) repeat protein